MGMDIYAGIDTKLEGDYLIKKFVYVGGSYLYSILEKYDIINYEDSPLPSITIEDIVRVLENEELEPDEKKELEELLEVLKNHEIEDDEYIQLYII